MSDTGCPFMELFPSLARSTAATGPDRTRGTHTTTTPPVRRGVAPSDLDALRAEVEAAVGPMERPMHRRRKREAAVSTDDLIRTYATTLQGIYDDRTGGFHSFVGVLAKFGKELLARDGDDRIDALRAEVEALQEEAWGDYTDAERIDDLNAEQRALGRCRMADKVLDLIDKHREGQ